MTGLNLGASLVPYATSILWEDFGSKGYRTLPWALLLCNCMPLPLLWMSPFVLERRERRDADARRRRLQTDFSDSEDDLDDDQPAYI